MSATHPDGRWIKEEVHFWRKEEEFNRFRFRIKADFALSLLFSIAAAFIPRNKTTTTLEWLNYPRLIY